WWGHHRPSDLGAPDMTAHVTALVAADVNYSSDSVGKIWVDSLVSMLTARGWTVHMLAREVDGVDRYGDIRNSGGLVVYPGDSPREHLDEHGLMPRFRARTIIAEAEKLAPDVVLVQGLTLSRYVAGSGRLSGRLWSIPLDRPYVGRSEERRVGKEGRSRASRRQMNK